MKPKSKKDQYTVECENREQTIKVLNYIDQNNDNEWSYWKYVTRLGDLDSSIECYNKYKYPVIKFEDWCSLPDEEFTLPRKWCVNGSEELAEYFKKIGVINLSGNYYDQYYYITYDGKWDCSLSLDGMTCITFYQFKEHVLDEKEVELKVIPFSELDEINPAFDKYGKLNFYKIKYANLGESVNNVKIEDNEEISGSLTEAKKIIRYELVKKEYKKAANIIANIDMESKSILINGFLPNSFCYDVFYKSGVLDLWFKPVYELSTEQKIIDYLSKKGTKLTKEEAEDIVKLVNEK